MPFTLPRSITVDFSTDAVAQPIKAVQGDQTRVAKITLLNKGVPVNLTGITVRAYVMPFGETVGLYEDVAVTDATAGKVEYSLSGNACIKAGDGSINIELLETATGRVSYTDEVPLKVAAKKSFAGAIVGSTAFSVLQTALTTVQTYLSRIVALEAAVALKINKAGGSANPFTAMPYVGTSPIIESGYVANKGSYVKYADGTMGCFYALPTTTTNDATFSLGGLTWYQSARNWTYPVEFYSILSSVTSCRQNTNNSVLVTNNIVQIDVTAVIVNSLTSFAAYGLTAVYCEAWGRWKA